MATNLTKEQSAALKIEMIVPMIASYPHLHDLDNFGRYSMSGMIPEDETEQSPKQKEFIKRFKAAEEKLCTIAKVKRLNPKNKCLKSEDERDKVDEVSEGMYVFSGNNQKNIIQVYGLKGGAAGAIDKSHDDFPYAGCEVFAKVEVWAKIHDGTPQLNGTVKAVQFKAHGDPIGFHETEAQLAEGFESLAEEGGDDVAF